MSWVQVTQKKRSCAATGLWRREGHPKSSHAGDPLSSTSSLEERVQPARARERFPRVRIHKLSPRFQPLLMFKRTHLTTLHTCRPARWACGVDPIQWQEIKAKENVSEEVINGKLFIPIFVECDLYLTAGCPTLSHVCFCHWFWRVSVGGIVWYVRGSNSMQDQRAGCLKVHAKAAWVAVCNAMGLTGL